MKITAAHVSRYLDKFHEIFDEKGKEINPLPENEPMIVYCESSRETGWCEVKRSIDLGLTALVAQKWILRKDLIKLIKS